MQGIVIAGFRKNKSRIQGSLVKENKKTVVMELPDCYIRKHKHVKRHIKKHQCSIIHSST